MKIFGIAAIVIVSKNGAESEKKQVGSLKTRRNEKSEMILHLLIFIRS